VITQSKVEESNHNTVQKSMLLNEF